MSETKGEYAAHISGALKPCPFCGDPDPVRIVDGRIYCELCGTFGPFLSAATWNTRALEADLQSRLADAEASLAGYRRVTDDLVRRLSERQP